MKLISLIFAAVFVLAACGNSDDVITLKLADNHPEDYPTVIGDKKFAELVEEKTDGRYKIDVYSGGQLGDEKVLLSNCN